jgi:hypothetical protein
VTKQSPDEWRRYVDGLDDDALVEATENANSAGFVRALQDEGYDAAEIDAVLRLFARRWRTLGQVPPAGGYVDLVWLADA